MVDVVTGLLGNPQFGLGHMLRDVLCMFIGCVDSILRAHDDQHWHAHLRQVGWCVVRLRDNFLHRQPQQTFPIFFSIHFTMQLNHLIAPVGPFPLHARGVERFWLALDEITCHIGIGGLHDAGLCHFGVFHCGHQRHISTIAMTDDMCLLISHGACEGSNIIRQLLERIAKTRIVGFSMPTTIGSKNPVMLSQRRDERIPIGVAVNRRAVDQHKGRASGVFIPVSLIINAGTIDRDVWHIAYLNTTRYNHRMTNILEDFAKSIDPRVTLFDVKVDSEMNGTIALSGRVLDASQLDELPRLFPGRNLDTASVRVLNAETHERVHVTTNLTGLYERPTFGMALSSELTYGTELEVLDERGKWVFTRQTDGYLGWAYRPYLGEESAPAPTHFLLAPAIELRAEPDITSQILTRLVSGTGLVVNGWENGRTDDLNGLPAAKRTPALHRTPDLLSKSGASVNGWVQVQANRVGWLPSVHLRALKDLPKSLDDKRLALVQDSQCMIGVPYLWGGTSGNGIDCSGLARLLHRWVGASIPRDADMQHAAAKQVEAPYEAGDLFFFAESDSNRKITHVGISLGGWKMIHSSRLRNGVYLDDLQQRGDLLDIFVGAGSFLR